MPSESWPNYPDRSVHASGKSPNNKLLDRSTLPHTRTPTPRLLWSLDRPAACHRPRTPPALFSPNLNPLPPFSSPQIAALSAVAFIAGLIDAMAGGGGIFTMPALAALGLPIPNIAGTNKFVGASGSSTATISFLARGKLDHLVAALGGGCALLGSIAGALALIKLGKFNEPLTKGLFGSLIIIMALYMFFKPHIGGQSNYQGPTRRNIFITISAGLTLGFYDGFFGPGTGSFLVFVMVRFLRFDFVTGTGNAKAMNLGSNLGSLATFIISGLVIWPLAIPMGIANAAGSFIGSSLAIKQGARFVRWAFLLAAAAIAARMLWFVVTGK